MSRRQECKAGVKQFAENMFGVTQWREAFDRKNGKINAGDLALAIAMDATLTFSVLSAIRDAYMAYSSVDQSAMLVNHLTQHIMGMSNDSTRQNFLLRNVDVFAQKDMSTLMKIYFGDIDKTKMDSASLKLYDNMLDRSAFRYSRFGGADDNYDFSYAHQFMHNVFRSDGGDFEFMNLVNEYAKILDPKDIIGEGTFEHIEVVPKLSKRQQMLQLVSPNDYPEFEKIKDDQKLYRQLSLKFHPDKGGDINKQQRLNSIYSSDKPDNGGMIQIRSINSKVILESEEQKILKMNDLDNDLRKIQQVKNKFKYAFMRSKSNIVLSLVNPRLVPFAIARNETVAYGNEAYTNKYN